MLLHLLLLLLLLLLRLLCLLRLLNPEQWHMLQLPFWWAKSSPIHSIPPLS